MIAREKDVLVDSLQEQEGKQARDRFQLVGDETGSEKKLGFTRERHPVESRAPCRD